MPVWITLRGVKDEFISIAQELAQGIGTVLGRHRDNINSADQRFCVAVEGGKPFILEIEALNPVTEEIVKIQADYNNLPIRCRLCLSTSHLIKDCPTAYGNRKPYQTRGDTQSNIGEETTYRTKGGGSEVRNFLPNGQPLALLPPQRLAGGGPSTGGRQHNDNRGRPRGPGEHEGNVEGTLLQNKSQSTPANVPGLQQQRPTYDQSRERLGIKTIDYGRWRSRERQRGYESSPNASEFSDINEFLEAKNFWWERKQAREKGVELGEDDDSPSVTMKNDEDTHGEEIDGGDSKLHGLQPDQQESKTPKSKVVPSGGEELKARAVEGAGETRPRNLAKRNLDIVMQEAEEQRTSPKGERMEGSGDSSGNKVAEEIGAELKDQRHGATGETAPTGPDQSPNVIRSDVAAMTIARFKSDQTNQGAGGGELPAQRVSRGEPTTSAGTNTEDYAEFEGAPTHPAWGNAFVNSLNRSVNLNSMNSNSANEVGRDNLSLDLDFEGGSEGGDISSMRTKVPAHLALYIKELLKNERLVNGYPPTSPLRPRRTLSVSMQRARGARFTPYGNVQRQGATSSTSVELPEPIIPQNNENIDN